MRSLLPWLAALVVLIALWPTLCMSSTDGPTSCQSIIGLTLPWGESADTWGMGVTLMVAGAAYLVVRALVHSRA